MKRSRAKYFEVACAVCAFAPIAAFAQTSTQRDLTQIPLEDLMNVQVVSVSRKEQKLSQTGAAVFVITRDDIRRAGAANVPDVLRMAPGVNVARVDANAWAVSIRGFNGRYSDKLLVLIDGRSIYSPAFSGVYWDQVDVPLEDIERIEIIRGPGGTAWGANAVNGVINIITMSSKATQGGLLVAQGGSGELGGLAQYGGKAGATGTYRAFGRYLNTNSSLNTAGAAAADGWHAYHGGFRFDLEPSARDTLMVQGDLYQTGEGQTVTTVLSDHLPTVATFNDPVRVNSGNLQARWNHTLQKGSDISVNLYFDHDKRLDQGLEEKSNTFDIDFLHHIAINSRNDLVWGLGYRVTNDAMTSGYSTAWFPTRRTTNLFSEFVQDEITIAKSARLTIGTKLEHNSYTGFEYEPSVQFVWTPTGRQTIWLSAARTIRQPSRQDTDILYDSAIIPLAGGAFGVLKFIGNKDIQAEQLRDYEAGYRTQITKTFSLDVAAFRGYYRQLQTSETPVPSFVSTPAPPHIDLSAVLVAAARTNTYGGEVFGTWSVTSRWRLSPGYSLLHMSPILDPSGQPSATKSAPGDTPKHQIQFRSTLGLRSNLDWDTSLYFVGKLIEDETPSYTRLDMQLRWRPGESIEFALAGQNLLTPRHTEFGDAYSVAHTQVQRSILGKITWRF
jgi:iron complex outermembrane receptor protein